MGAVVEVKYFNSFVAKKSSNGTDIPSWYGSWGIPSNLNGGFDTSSATPRAEDWTIEEARIRGGYNNTTVDFSPRAYLVEDEPSLRNRKWILFVCFCSSRIIIFRRNK